jgi:hypothetical protein
MGLSLWVSKCRVGHSAVADLEQWLEGRVRPVCLSTSRWWKERSGWLGWSWAPGCPRVQWSQSTGEVGRELCVLVWRGWTTGIARSSVAQILPEGLLSGSQRSEFMWRFWDLWGRLDPECPLQVSSDFCKGMGWWTGEEAGRIKWLASSLTFQRWSLYNLPPLLVQIDLRYEAQNLEHFQCNFQNVTSVKFPTPLHPFVARDVLVETYEVRIWPCLFFIPAAPIKAFSLKGGYGSCL